MINKLAPLLRRIKRGDMPSYIELRVGEYLVSVVPAGLRSIIKSQPFYNGVDIWFDLKVKKLRPQPRKNIYIFSREAKIDEIFTLQWCLFDRDTQKLEIEPKQEEYHIRNKKVKKTSAKLRRITWEYRDNDVLFTIYNAIHVGRLWEFHRYDLCLMTNSGREIIAEFTLHDIDEHGENYHILIISAVISIIVAFIVALITAMFTR